MRKFFGRITVAILIINFCCLSVGAAKIDYAKINAELDKCHQERTSKCYQNLLYPYKLNIIRYYYALALMNENKYSNAKTELQTIVSTEKDNLKLYTAAQQQIQNIEKRQADMRNANTTDWGDYFSSISDTAKWRNPRDIKVYIQGNTGKENILKRAFSIWDNSVGDISFTYVYSPEKADIICYFVDKLTENRAGVTNSKMSVMSDGTKYLNKAEVQVAFYRPGTTGKFTDDNLLATTLHEIGHALGIQSHSPNKNDIMYYSTDTYKNTNISRRDINTIKKLYY